MITKKEEEEAPEAFMEESGKAYYDKEKGKWVFEGEEDEVEEEVKAPPTFEQISKLSKSIKE